MRETLARDITGYAIVSVYARFFEECGFAEEVEAVNRAWKAGDRAGAVKEISPRVLEGLGAVGSAEACRAQMAAFAAHRGDPGGAAVRAARPRRARVAPAHLPLVPGMKPAPFEYHRPASLAETFDLLDRYGDDGRLLAGGQSLVPALNMRLATPRAVIDINRLPDLDAIRVTARRARDRRARAAGGASSARRSCASTRRSSPRRCRTSATRRSGRAAPSAAASRWPIPPPSCPPAWWRWTRRSAVGPPRRRAEIRRRRLLPRASTRPRSSRARSSPRSWCRARAAGWRSGLRRAGASPRRLRPRRPRRARARGAADASREARLVFFGVGTRPGARAARRGRARRPARRRGRARRGGPGARRRPRSARRRPRLAGAAPPSGPRAARARRGPARGRRAREDRADRQRHAGRRARSRPRQNLVDFLRYDLELTGSHVGCEHGVCGACTVRVDGTLVRGCLMLAVQADGCRVETIEGVAETRRDRRAPAGVPRGERAAVRLLHAGHAADRARAARAQPASRPGGHPRGDRRQLLPLHRLSRDRRRRSWARRGAAAKAPAATRPARPPDERRATSDARWSGRRPRGSSRDAARTPTTSRCRASLHAAFVRSPHAHARIARHRHRGRRPRCPAWSRS